MVRGVGSLDLLLPALLLIFSGTAAIPNYNIIHRQFPYIMKPADHTKLTNEVGAPVADNEHSLTAGPRGPVMLQDVWLLEKLAHFNREVIPERRMHAKGTGRLR